MGITININVTGYRTFLRKVLLTEETEWFLLKNFKTPGISETIESYYKELDKVKHEADYDLGKIFYITTVIHKMLLKKAPNKNQLLIGIRCDDIFFKDNGTFLRVTYTYE